MVREGLMTVVEWNEDTSVTVTFVDGEKLTYTEIHDLKEVGRRTQEQLDSVR